MSRLSVKQWDRLTRIFAAAFFISAGLTAVVGYLNFSKVITVSANSSDISNARSQYPGIVGTRIDSCSLCHTSSIPSLNSFGNAYKNNGRSTAAFSAISGQDSDGDSFTNAQEIAALFFPGDLNDHPTVPTATQVPPTATQVPPTATQIPPTDIPPTDVPPTETQVPPTDVPPTDIPQPTETQVNPPTDTPVVEPTATQEIEPTETPVPTLEPSPTATLQCKNDDDDDGDDKKYEEKDKEKDKDRDKDMKEKGKRGNEYKDKSKTFNWSSNVQDHDPCESEDDDDGEEHEDDHSQIGTSSSLVSNDAGVTVRYSNG